jgi:hypothetical protein
MITPHELKASFAESLCCFSPHEYCTVAAGGRRYRASTLNAMYTNASCGNASISIEDDLQMELHLTTYVGASWSMSSLNGIFGSTSMIVSGSINVSVDYTSFVLSEDDALVATWQNTTFVFSNKTASTFDIRIYSNTHVGVPSEDAVALTATWRAWSYVATPYAMLSDSLADISSPPVAPALPCVCQLHYDLEAATKASSTFLDSTTALYAALDTDPALPFETPVYNQSRGGCTCRSASYTIVWLTPLDMCYWIEQNASRQSWITDDSLGAAYMRTCRDGTPSVHRNDHWFHIRVCVSSDAFEELYTDAMKEYCDVDGVIPRVGYDGAFYCGSEVGLIPTSAPPTAQDTWCACNVYYDYARYTSLSDTLLGTVDSIYAMLNETDSAWPFRAPITVDGECRCDDAAYRPSWYGPIDLCDYYASQNGTTQQRLVKSAYRQRFERGCNLAEVVQNDDCLHIKLCAHVDFVREYFYGTSGLCRTSVDHPTVAPDGLLFCQKAQPSQAAPVSPQRINSGYTSVFFTLPAVLISAWIVYWTSRKHLSATRIVTATSSSIGVKRHDQVTVLSSSIVR